MWLCSVGSEYRHAALGPCTSRSLHRSLARLSETTSRSLFTPRQESNAAALEEGASLASARAAEALRALLDRGLDVYLLAHVASDVGEAVVRGALEAEGLLGAGPGQVSPHRLLLCGTQIGKVSVVRQLEPELHIDADAETVRGVTQMPGAGRGQEGIACSGQLPVPAHPIPSRGAPRLRGAALNFPQTWCTFRCMQTANGWPQYGGARSNTATLQTTLCRW